MTDHELLLAISDMMDVKLKSELQPVKNELKEMKTDIREIKEDVRNLKTDVRIMQVDVENMKEDIRVLPGNGAVFKTSGRRYDSDHRSSGKWFSP